MSVKLPFKDEDLITRSFRLMSDGIKSPEEALLRSDYDLYTSYFSTAIGDNKFINPLPGYGINTDPYPKPIMENTMGNLGRYYKRIHQDNAQMVTLTAGVPEFTGMLQFLLNMFDYSASVLVNKGRAPTWAFYIGQAAGAIAFFPAQIVATSWNFFEFLTNTPKNKWYYHKNAMGAYYAAAQGIFNDLMVAAGWTLTVLPKQGDTIGVKAGAGPIAKGYDTRTSAAKANYSYMNSMFPDAINEDGTIDIMKVACRGVRKYRYFIKKIKDLDDNKGIRTVEEKDKAIENILDKLIKDSNFVNGKIGPAADKSLHNFLMEELKTVNAARGPDEISYPELASSYTNPEVYAKIQPEDPAFAASNGTGGQQGFQDIRQKLATYDPGSYSLDNSKGGANGTTPDLNGTVPNSFDDGSNLTEAGWLTEVGSLLMDQFYGGTDGVTFRTEGTGSVSDSFSNQTTQSAIASTFNNTVQAVSDFKFNIAGGNTGIDIIDGFMGTVKDAFAGVMAGSVIGNIPLALLGNSRVEIPEHWQDSTTNIHTESFNFYFEAPYAHPYSIATNVFLPLSLILPFVIPFATGGSTYGSPFLVKCFQQGKSIIRLGIVRDASITFGEGPLGWTVDMKPRNCRVSLNVADLEQVMAAPISRVTNPLDLLNMAAQSSRYLGDIGKYNDWINRTAGTDFLDTILRYNDLNRRLTRFTTDVKQMFSPAKVAGVVNDSIVGDIARIVLPRPLNR